MIGSVELAAALLLAGAGAAKLRAPQPAAAMLRRARLASLRPGRSRILIRTVGVAELGIGLAACVTGGRVAAALLGCCYVAFLIVAVRLLRGGHRASCGCFGATDSPVGAGHLVVNLVGIATASATVARPTGAVGGLLDDERLAGVVGVGQAVLLAYLAFLSITALPALLAARRRLLEAG